MIQNVLCNGANNYLNIMTIVHEPEYNGTLNTLQFWKHQYSSEKYILRLLLAHFGVFVR